MIGLLPLILQAMTLFHPDPVNQELLSTLTTLTSFSLHEPMSLVELRGFQNRGSHLIHNLTLDNMGILFRIYHIHTI